MHHASCCNPKRTRMINNERLLKNFTTKESIESKESNIYDNRVSPLFSLWRNQEVKKYRITTYQITCTWRAGFLCFCLMFDYEILLQSEIRKEFEKVWVFWHFDISKNTFPCKFHARGAVEGVNCWICAIRRKQIPVMRTEDSFGSL